MFSSTTVSDNEVAANHGQGQNCSEGAQYRGAFLLQQYCLDAPVDYQINQLMHGLLHHCQIQTHQSNCLQAISKKQEFLSKD